VADSDYLNRSIMVVCGPGGVRERIESATEARRTCDIANIAHAAGKRAVEGDLLHIVRSEIASGRNFGGDGDLFVMATKALASAGQEVKP
jgi:hypothetical protein